MLECAERFCIDRCLTTPRPRSGNGDESVSVEAVKLEREQRWQAMRGEASPAAAVMLHLRSCYVSKAAILTVSGTPRAGRKSKSRLNSKGLDR
jgi:hypothetical protein